MKKKNVKKFHIIVTAMITITMATGLALPLQAEASSTAPKVPVFSDKASIDAKMVPVKKKIKKKKVVMNLRLEAGEGLYGYDTLQGSCYGNGYYYYILFNRNKNKSKVVKMRMSDKTVVKVSKSLSLYHANDMTYNTDKKCLVVAHGRGDKRGLSVISPTSLKIKNRYTVDLPEELDEIAETKKQRKRLNKYYNGFNNIAYNSKHKLYVVQLYTIRDFLFLNEKFKPVRYVRLYERDSQLYQGMDSFGDNIVVCNSFSSGKPYNVLSVYDWDGNYLQKIKLNRGMELESLIHIGNKLYAGFYKAYTARYQMKSRPSFQINKYKVKKKVLIKSGKNKGKYKTVYKYKKRVVKVRVYYKDKKKLRWMNRDNLLYRVKLT